MQGFYLLWRIFTENFLHQWKKIKTLHSNYFLQMCEGYDGTFKAQESE